MRVAGRWTVFAIALLLFLNKISVFVLLLVPAEQRESIAPMTGGVLNQLGDPKWGEVASRFVVQSVFWSFIFGWATLAAFRWARRGPEPQR